MATILNDAELKRLLGTVIKNGSEDNVRSNSYIVRLGGEGEFLGTDKSFTLGNGREHKKGIKLPPGHSVGLSSFEEIDFSPETVNKLFPEHALHGMLSPTTDFSRESISAPSTHIDAGFCGTLNWTLTNTGSQERRYVYGEKLFRLTIFKLDKTEVPQTYYDGSYQKQTGYTRSTRKGAPVGMQEHEWEAPFTGDGVEESLERLMQAGYPWQAVAAHLQKIDDQFGMVSNEYLKIDKAIETINSNMVAIENSISDRVSSNMVSTIDNAVEKGIVRLYNWAIVKLFAVLAVVVGLVISITANANAFAFVVSHGVIIGLVTIALGIGFLIWSLHSKNLRDK